MEANPGLLPADVLLKIFSYCSYRDLVQFQFVCRWWQQVSRHRHLWRDIVYKPERLNTTRQIIENLKKSPELRALDLGGVECRTVTKELVVEIANACPRLEQLSMCWNCVYEKFCYKMETIKILILYRHKDCINLPDHLVYLIDSKQFYNFEHLYNRFPNVEHLDCRNLCFEVTNFRAYLQKAGQFLHTLGLNRKMFGFEKGIRFKERILLDLSMCTKLKNLILSHKCLDMGVLPDIESVDYLKQITSLTLEITCWDCDDSFMSMFRYFPNLVELESDTCILNREETLYCPLLEKLTISKNFSDYSIENVPRFKKLTSLCLRTNHRITDACVAHIQDILDLRYLDISHCYQLTPQCLLALCSIAKLQILKFDLLDKYIPTSLDVSQVKNPDLHIMFYNCKDTRGLDNLRRQRLRISLLKGFMMCDSELFCHYCKAYEGEY